MTEQMKHRIELETDNGFFVISTNDISDLFKQGLFDKLGIAEAKPQEASAVTGDDVIAHVNKLGAVVGQLQKQIQQMNESTQSPPQQQPRRPPQQRESPATPSQDGAGTEDQGQPRDFLQVSPDQMSGDLWNSLTPQQQQEYTRQYGLG